MNTQSTPTPENNLQGNWPSNFQIVYSGQTSLPAPESQLVQSSPKLTPVVYTIEEAAVVLNVCTKTVRRLIDRRLLTCCRVLRKKLIPREQIERFLKATCDVPTSLK